MNLYPVTTMGEGRDNHPRTPAVCTELGIAQGIVDRNDGDLYEAGHYPLIVIEEIVADCVYAGVGMAAPSRRTQWWYKFDTAKRKYLPCRKPRRWEGAVGFGVG